jgi:hypothetical protein
MIMKGLPHHSRRRGRTEAEVARFPSARQISLGLIRPPSRPRIDRDLLEVGGGLGGREEEVGILETSESGSSKQSSVPELAKLGR